MPRNRSKSAQQIIRQRNRIQMAMYNDPNFGRENARGRQLSQRYRNVVNTTSRYISNIERNIGSTLTADGRWGSNGYVNVSRRTYMGLANG